MGVAVDYPPHRTMGFVPGVPLFAPDQLEQASDTGGGTENALPHDHDQENRFLKLLLHL